LNQLKSNKKKKHTQSKNPTKTQGMVQEDDANDWKPKFKDKHGMYSVKTTQDNQEFKMKNLKIIKKYKDKNI